MEKKQLNGERTVSTDYEVSSIWGNCSSEVSFNFLYGDYPTWHTHDDFCEILCILSGEIENLVNDGYSLMQRGDCCIMTYNDRHRINQKNAHNVLGINFLIKRAYFDKLICLFGEEGEAVFLQKDKPKKFHINDIELDKIYRRILLLQTKREDYVHRNEIICKDIVVDLIKTYIVDQIDNRRIDAIPAWFVQLLNDIRDPKNMGLRPNEIIAGVSYSMSSITKAFQKYLGHSFVKHLTDVKLEYAKELLKNTSMTMLDICSKLGFSSLSHFNHIFKRQFGITPSEFRKKQK